MDAAFFESRVRPVLAARCFGCHGPERQLSSLRLDSAAGVAKGGQRGPAAEWIGKAIRQEGDLKMPPGGKLAAGELAALEDWVGRGLPWPAAAAARKDETPHWAFQPLMKPGPRTIDEFLREKRREKGLGQSAPADKRVIARRAAYVVTGLPPKPEQLARFLGDSTEGAWGNYVDALLDSPRYGERWARHWMDLMRYAETYGYEWNYEIQGAWRYRDYLIRAFNGDLPYDQFVREHVAGDLLAPRIENGRNESVAATASYRLGEMGHDNCNQFPEIRTDVVDNQIDTLTKAFQGLTVSCARCHDHKFDPIPIDDYYALYGILNSSRPVARTLNAPARQPDLEVVKNAVRAELAAVWLREAADIGKHWGALVERKDVGVVDPVYAVLHPEHRYPDADAAPSINFANGLPEGWTMEGLGIGRVSSGSFALATQGEKALEAIFAAGLATNVATDRWNGTLRSPMLPRDRKNITLELRGANAAAHRVILDHCVIGEDHKLIGREQAHLEKIGTRNEQPLRTYLEVNTVTDNPRLPERPGKFKTNPPEGGERSWFAVTKAWFHDEEDGPKPPVEPLRRFLAGERTQERVAQFLSEAVRRWRDGQASDEDVFWLNWGLGNQLLTNRRDATEGLRRAVEMYRAAEAKLEAPAVAGGMADLDAGADFPVLLSGQARNPGRPAERHYLSSMPEKLRPVDGRGSGRREMAEAMASRENPLTARVYVNRVWRQVFGRGLVATTDNFGRLGEAPSHPELLDYLAGWFMDEGWSTKKLVRKLLLTEAFQQQSATKPEWREKDPENAYLHHYPVRRMEAEAVRDTILAVSGRLDETMYGPSVQPHRTTPVEHRRLFQGPLDGDGRRSIYIKVTRMDGPKFLEAFDFPAPLQGRGNRDITNVPSQALAMMNDPFVMQQAKVWAARVTSGTEESFSARLDSMFVAGLGRRPTEREVERYRSLAAKLDDPWVGIAHTIFNSKEFLYIP